MEQITRIKLTVAYDGTNYHGWQFQPNVNTIEGELKRAIAGLINEEFTLIGASRTDTGVHALCNVAVFNTTSPIPPEKISHALNQRLPEDIRVQTSEAVALDFHPRKVESRKTYQYRIWNARIPQPTKRLYHHFIHQHLDISFMQTAAAYLVGEFDFLSFCTAKKKTGIKGPDSLAESTVRTIYFADVTSIPDYSTNNCADDTSSLDIPGSAQNTANNTTPHEIIITLTGNGFLYNMVRIIAGTLIEVGIGRYPPERINEILAAGDRTLAGPTAPPQGLTLVKYEYLQPVSLLPQST